MTASIVPAEGAEHWLPIEEYYAKTVVVPLSRPDTASEMLNIAGEMVHPTEGLVIALLISLGNAERTMQVSDQMQKIIDEFRNLAGGHKVELVTEMAISVSRGILDVARERNADVIILGVQRSTKGRVKLGTVVENVIATAPCGVLIYRSSPAPEFDQVVVPVDGRQPATNAVKLGVSFALQHEIPLQQLNVQFNYHYNPAHEEAIKEYESHLPQAQDLRKKIIVSRPPAPEILQSLTANDLLVMGFSQKTDFERQITNDLSNQLLNQAPGPVILISQIAWHRGFLGLIEHSLAWLNPRLTLVEQNELIWSAQKNANKSIDYFAMIVLSAALATLGLLTNSVAVIIGAMLVAPLMSPLSGFSVGMATGILTLTRRASTTLVQGVAMALLISVAMGLLLPIDTPTEEMLARGSPNLLDAAIALVSGWVAAYATARKGIPAALAGVAIAAALMPPICTIGLGFALGEINLAFGSSLLFLANITFIIVAQYVIFLWMGMHPHEDREGATLNQSRAWWFVLFVITTVVLLVFVRLGSRAVDEAIVREQLQAQAFPGAQVVEYQVSSGASLEVQLLVQSDHAITSDEIIAAQEIVNRLYQQEVELTVVSRQIVRPLDPLVHTASDILHNAFPQAEFQDVTVEWQTPPLIRATLLDQKPPAQWEIAAARQLLSIEAGQELQLEIAYQQLLFATVPPSPTPAEAETH